MTVDRPAPPPRIRVLLTLPDHPAPANSGKRMRCAATLSSLVDLARDLDADLDVMVIMAGPGASAPGWPGVRSWLQLDPRLRSRCVAVPLAILGRLPWQVAVVRWRALRSALADLPAPTYDLIWFGSLDHASGLARHVASTAVVVDLDDVETEKARAFLALPSDTVVTTGQVRLQRRLELPLWARLQDWAQRRADVVVVCSELDRARLRDPEKVHVVPNTYSTPGPPPPRPAREPIEAPVLLFVGTYSYGPNLDAAEFAARQVLPLVRERHPRARLRLVGRGGGGQLAALGELPGVEVIGPVPRMEPELTNADVSLVPVRYGGGTRLKVLEAFTHRIPVVSTSLGCEGLGVKDGEHLLVGEHPGELAEAVCTLLEDEALRSALVDRANDLVRLRFGPAVAAAAVRSAALTALRRSASQR